MEKYKDILKKTYNYYQVLTSEHSQEFIYNIEGLGKLSLKVLLNSNLHRQVLITRINGMKLFDRGYISSTIHFAGILRLIDEPVNEFFRLLEPPEHNAWEPERHPNKKLAKERVADIYRYLKNQIIEIGKIPIADEIDAEGVGEYLPDDVSLLDTYSSEDKDESISNRISNIDIVARERTIKPNGEEKRGNKESTEEKDIFGDADEEGDIEGGNPTANANNSDGGSGLGGRYSENTEGQNQIKKAVQVKTIKRRLFIVDGLRNKYKLIFTPIKSFKEGYIKFEIVGEQGNSKALIRDAQSECDQNKSLISKEDRIYIKNINEGSSVRLTFILEYSKACSLEVEIYGYTE